MAVTTLAAVVCAALAAGALPGPSPTAARLRRALGRSPAPPRSGRAGPGAATTGVLSSARARALVAALGAVGVLAVVGGFAGVVVAAFVGVATWVGLSRLEPPGLVRDRERAVAAVPLTADLLAAALGAGCPPVVAVAAVAEAVGGPLGSALRTAAATARIGADPTRAWAAMAADPGLRPLARALAAATGRGTSPVPVLQRVADDARDTARRAAEARARSLGARAAAPLGLCFLPAFVLVGVVPIVVTAGGFLL